MIFIRQWLMGCGLKPYAPHAKTASQALSYGGSGKECECGM